MHKEVEFLSFGQLFQSSPCLSNELDVARTVTRLLNCLGAGTYVCVGDESDAVAGELRRIGAAAFSLPFGVLAKEKRAVEASPTSIVYIRVGSIGVTRGKLVSFCKVIEMLNARNVVIDVRGIEDDVRWNRCKSDIERVLFSSGFRRHPMCRSAMDHNSLVSSLDHLFLTFEKAVIENCKAERTVLAMRGVAVENQISLIDACRRYISDGDIVFLDKAVEGFQDVFVYGSGSGGVCLLNLSDGQKYDRDKCHNLPSILVTIDKSGKGRLKKKGLSEIGKVIGPADRIAIMRAPSKNPKQISEILREVRENIGNNMIFDDAWAIYTSEKIGRPGEMRRLSASETFPARAWQLLVCMKVPELGALDNEALAEKGLRHPWLTRSLISMGKRLNDPRQLAEHAHNVLKYALTGSAEEGAAICVAIYRIIEYVCSCEVVKKDADELLRRAGIFFHHADCRARSSLRWRISVSYAAGVLCSSLGYAELSIEWFTRCVQIPPRDVTPLIATKTVGAYLRIGLMNMSCDNREAAKHAFRSGFEVGMEVIGTDWLRVVDTIDDPNPWGMQELSQVCILTGRCARAVRYLSRGCFGGRLWHMIHDGIPTERYYIDLAYKEIGLWSERLRKTGGAGKDAFVEHLQNESVRSAV